MRKRANMMGLAFLFAALAVLWWWKGWAYCEVWLILLGLVFIYNLGALLKNMNHQQPKRGSDNKPH